MFGPIPRDYSYNLPKKVKRLSIKSILTDKMRKNKLRVIEDIDVQSGKTKEAVNVLLNLLTIKNKLDKLNKNQATKEINKYRVTVIVTDEDKNLKRAIKNIRWAKTLNYNRLSSHNLFILTKFYA